MRELKSQIEELMSNLGAQKEKLSQQKMEHETEVSKKMRRKYYFATYWGISKLSLYSAPHLPTSPASLVCVLSWCTDFCRVYLGQAICRLGSVPLQQVCPNSPKWFHFWSKQKYNIICNRVLEIIPVVEL